MGSAALEGCRTYWESLGQIVAKVFGTQTPLVPGERTKGEEEANWLRVRRAACYSTIGCQAA
eukprot:682362-Amphidinium_carterae.2